MAKRFTRKETASREISTLVHAANRAAWVSPFRGREDWFLGMVLVLGVILIYWPVWKAGFVWDDDIFLTTNPCITGPFGLKDIWTTSAADICPLTLTAVWIEHALWGLAPLPYHLVNVILHAACAVLLWKVLRNLQIPGAWLGAALWALHPVQAESVAWVTEMKNTQSGLFFLLSVLFFVKDTKRGDISENSSGYWNYAMTLLFAALAMASKSSAAVLPVVLCLCGWWVEGRWQWRHLARVGPILMMSVAAGALSIWTQRTQMETVSETQTALTWLERLLIAGDVVWFYLGKLIWPYPLMAIYPRWKIETGELFSYLPLLTLMVILVILWIKRESWSRPVLFGLAYFLAALLPVLGFVDLHFQNYSFVADHFQYLASMGPLALAGTGLFRLGNWIGPSSSWRLVLCAGLLLVLGITSRQRVWAYHNNETLWMDTLEKNPDCVTAHYNLGVILFQKGQMDGAIAHYQKALESNPTSLERIRDNLGNALLQEGRIDEAMAQFQEILKTNPQRAETLSNLGVAYLQKRQVDTAISEYQKALEFDPNYVAAHYNLGIAFVQKGQMDDAFSQFQKAVEINPHDANACNDFGWVLLQKGQVGHAVDEIQKALAIDPNLALAHYNLGNALVQKGQISDAIAQFQEALHLNPNLPNAQDHLIKAQAMIRQQMNPK